MQPLIDFPQHPALLVSVRDAREAIAALDGGAHVIDVKEPNRGSLGAADAATISAVVRAVNGRAPVSAAAGELVDLLKLNPSPIPKGVALFKIGLAGCRELPNWQSQWRETIDLLWPTTDATRHGVAVAYADWPTASAPPPLEVLRAAADLGCPALLVDTWNKSSGPLFDHWPASELTSFVQSARAHRMLIVLAGSLTGENLNEAARLQPDLIAVRTAACDSDRTGPVTRARVASVRQAIASRQPDVA